MAYGLQICAVCGATEGVEDHHLYLRSEGCPDDLTVWLCHACHGRAHSMTRRVNIQLATKAALQAAKDRGVKLGGWRGGPKVDRATAVQRLANGRATNTQRSCLFAERIAPVAREMRASGMSFAAIAVELAAQGIVTPRGGSTWTATAVRRVLMRCHQDDA
jgi:hypothetical protein